jgi:predicted NBD/HSP70 family sugar kinase
VNVTQDAMPRDDTRARVVDALRRHGSVSRRELMLLTGLSRSTVSLLVGDLQARGQLLEEPTVDQAGGRGRPAMKLRFAASAGVVLSIDLGHDHIAAAVGNLSGDPLAERSTSHGEGTGDGAPRLAAELAAAAIAAAGVEPSAVVGTVVSLPGPVRICDDEIARSPLLPNWVRPGTALDLRERFGGHVRFENDANLAAYAEHCFGAGRGVDDLVYVIVDNGIGAGLVLTGRPYIGAAGLAGELGHIRVQENGAVCRCGNRGCLGTVAGATPLLELLRPVHGPDLTLQGMLDLVEGGDESARRLVQEAGHAIGKVLAALCNHLNLARIVVGGGMSEAEGPLLASICASIEQDALPGTAGMVEVVRGQLGTRATLLGGLALGARDTERLPSANLAVATAS